MRANASSIHTSLNNIYVYVPIFIYLYTACACASMTKIDREPAVTVIGIQTESVLDIEGGRDGFDLPSTCEEGLEVNRFRV